MARRPSPGRRPAPLSAAAAARQRVSVVAWRSLAGGSRRRRPRRHLLPTAAPRDARPPWPAGDSVRAAVKEANPEAEAKDMLKLLAQAWKDVSEEEQLKWKGEAEADKARYFAECKEAGVEPLTLTLTLTLS